MDKTQQIKARWAKAIEMRRNPACSDIAYLLDQNEKLRGMLRRVEWTMDTNMKRYCPICEALESKHAPDCELAALMKEGE